MRNGSLGTALKLVEMRIRDHEAKKAAAIADQRWSQVAGWDGISIGLLMAAKIIREELSD